MPIQVGVHGNPIPEFQNLGPCELTSPVSKIEVRNSLS